MPQVSAKVAEGKPWEDVSADGSPNLGSYEYQAVLSVVELAHELLFFSVDEGDQVAVDMAKAKSLARTLLRICDNAQAAVRSDRRVSRMDNSHTRARGAVREALRAFPVPFGSDDTTRQEWESQVTARAVAFMKTALDLFAGEAA
jgi:hypothetical protein